MGNLISRKIKANIVNIKVSSRPHAWNPPTDLLETGEEFLIRVEIAGLNIEDLTISVIDQVITVVGTRDISNKKCAYHRMEIPYGEFRTEIRLPSRVDSSNAFAEYQDGFLSITLPKAKVKHIKVNSTKE